MVHKYQKKHNRRRSLAWLWITLGALAITAVGIFALSSQAGPSASPTPTVTVAKVSPAEAYAEYQQGPSSWTCVRRTNITNSTFTEAL